MSNLFEKLEITNLGSLPISKVFYGDKKEPKMIIKDPIYRFINVSPICRAFIDTREFQRLREIKQLGCAQYVYPSATHTRFEHSLGVMFLAEKVANTLKENGANISDREISLLKIAGLVHDLGHVSFSHLFDNILSDEKVGEPHELRSIYLLKRINSRKKILTETEEQIISDMILGNFRNKTKPFLYQIICNKHFGIDVDRIDYLQRDAYHTGMPFFQGDYLIECLRINEKNELTLLEKAKPEMYELFNTRRRLLLLICRHKVVIQIESLLKEFIKSFIIPKYWKKEFDWLDLTDSFVTCKLNELCPEILTTIYTRDFKFVSLSKNEKYEHLSFINNSEIEALINNAFTKPKIKEIEEIEEMKEPFVKESSFFIRENFVKEA